MSRSFLFSAVIVVFLVISALYHIADAKRVVCACPKSSIKAKPKCHDCLGSEGLGFMTQKIASCKPGVSETACCQAEFGKGCSLYVPKKKSKPPATLGALNQGGMQGVDPLSKNGCKTDADCKMCANKICQKCINGKCRLSL